MMMPCARQHLEISSQDPVFLWGCTLNLAQLERASWEVGRAARHSEVVPYAATLAGNQNMFPILSCTVHLTCGYLATAPSSRLG